MQAKTIRLITLAIYVLLFAGGPGLHYAPFMGMHGHDGSCAAGACSHGSHVESHSSHDGFPACHGSCSCSHSHSEADNSAAWIAGIACDGNCALCKFYSQFNPTLDPIALVPDSAPHVLMRVSGTPVELLRQTASYFSRGPPLS